MAQISKIIRAWSKVLKGLTTEQDRERAKICSKCPSAKHTKYLDFINDDLEEINGYICSECSCPLVAKIRSTDKCPKNLW